MRTLLWLVGFAVSVYAGISTYHHADHVVRKHETIDPGICERVIQGKKPEVKKP